MASESEVTKIFAILSLAYPNYKIKEGTIEVYASMLTDIPFDALQASAKSLMATSTFFPSLAELRQRALDITLAKSGIPMAIEAWEEAKREVGRCGEYWLYQQGKKLPEYSHPLIEQTVNAIGYVNILESDNIEVLRAQFMKAFDAFKGRMQEDQRMLPDVKAVEGRYLPDAIKHLTTKMIGG